MADSSENSTKSGKPRIRKTVSLTREQALEILQQSVIECQNAGIDVRIVPKFYSSGEQFAGILMANVEFINGNLVLINGNQAEITGKE